MMRFKFANLRATEWLHLLTKNKGKVEAKIKK
jgi:hypothetical protein